MKHSKIKMKQEKETEEKERTETELEKTQNTCFQFGVISVLGYLRLGLGLMVWSKRLIENERPVMLNGGRRRGLRFKGQKIKKMSAI